MEPDSRRFFWGETGRRARGPWRPGLSSLETVAIRGGRAARRFSISPFRAFASTTPLQSRLLMYLFRHLPSLHERTLAVADAPGAAPRSSRVHGVAGLRSRECGSLSKRSKCGHCSRPRPPAWDSLPPRCARPMASTISSSARAPTKWWATARAKPLPLSIRATIRPWSTPAPRLRHQRSGGLRSVVRLARSAEFSSGGRKRLGQRSAELHSNYERREHREFRDLHGHDQFGRWPLGGRQRDAFRNFESELRWRKRLPP